jgi:hypothetical protein
MNLVKKSSRSILTTFYATAGLLLTTLLGSCGSCKDCGPQTTYAFGITNATGEVVEFTFYFGTDSVFFFGRRYGRL